MATDERRIEKGDRFEDRDRRNPGRIVEVRAVEGDVVRVQVEVHPNNPSAVGRRSSLLAANLRTRYRRVSR